MGKIIFWDDTISPTKTGGTLRIMELLTIEFLKTKEVLFIGNKNSSVINKLMNEGVNIKWIELTEPQIDKHISKNDLLIVFFVNQNLKMLKKINPYILFWNVYPFFSSLNFYRWIRYKFFIKNLYKKKSFVVMDPQCKKTIFEKFRINIKNDYLRVPINVLNNEYQHKLSKSIINFSYIGRGDERALWKIKPLVKLIKDLSNQNLINFKVHIFTDTTVLFEKELKYIKINNGEIKYHIGYWGKTLSTKLIEVSDIHYSMGAAMLEGAKLGIPTVVADAGWNDFPNNYKYNWFINNVNDYAGKFIDNTQVFNGNTIEEIIKLLLDTKKTINLSNKQFNIIKNKFDVKVIAKKIIDTKPQARITDISNYFPKMYLK